ncbi:hypothetical protein PRZ48_003768 [Zasmidium cellare]|uniref:3-hydroxyisobutyrate dehydrogenase n=1 Tax=Zasmidium cellare TaxID=395010 RepID=A0ABR0EXA5_ZASCE|nr:hypothetical protein PRZ48_003768 [Zasmidium cellare]
MSATASGYGFIGLGNMGFGMALNIRGKLPKETTLNVCELDEHRRMEFKEQASAYGPVEVSNSPKELAGVSNVILTSLPFANAVADVFENPSTGLLAASPKGSNKLFIDLSTIEVSASLAVGEAVAKSEAGVFIDAPVSGGIPAADNGTLSLMVGGREEEFDRALPILEMIGRKESIFYCGKAGAGLAAKQINNYIANVSFLALGEGMNTGIRFGLDPKILAEVINAGSGMCWNSLHMNPVKGVQPNSSASRDFEGGFKTELAHDVTCMAVQLMDDVGAKHVLGNVIKDVYDRALESPHCKGKECRSIYRLLVEDDGKGLGTTKIE